MNITVQRTPADKQGPDIIDDLLTDELTGRERGSREIDYNCSPRIIEQCQGPKRAIIETGSLAQMIEAEKIWKGKVKLWSRIITLDGENSRYMADMNVYIERERDNG